MKTLLPITISILLLSSCSGRWDIGGFFAQSGKDVEQRFEESMAFNSENPEIIISLPKDNYRFYAGGDCHIENTTNNLTKLVTLSRNDSASAFTFLLGDFINVKGAFKFVPDAIKFDASTQNFNTPLFPVLGNHDIYFGQWKDYAEIFGTACYTFVIETPNFADLYIILDSSSGTLGRSQLKWLKELLKTRNNYRHCIIATHTNMFKTDNSQTTSGNFALEETMELIGLMAERRVDMFLNGHDHYFGYDHFNGVLYLTDQSMQDYIDKAAFLIIDISDEINFEKVKF
jgi:predicted phosphodiesterase